MDQGNIFFRTTGGDVLSNPINYANLDTSELKVLAQCARDALSSLEVELGQRENASAFFNDLSVKDCAQKLDLAAQNIKTLSRLRDKEARPVYTACKDLVKDGGDVATKAYRDFLNNVARQYSLGLAFLCIVSLEKYKIRSLKVQSRTNLLSYIESRKKYLDPAFFDKFAEQYNLPLSISTPNPSNRAGATVRELKRPTKRSRPDQSPIDAGQVRARETAEVLPSQRGRTKWTPTSIRTM